MNNLFTIDAKELLEWDKIAQYFQSNIWSGSEKIIGPFLTYATGTSWVEFTVLKWQKKFSPTILSLHFSLLQRTGNMDTERK